MAGVDRYGNPYNGKKRGRKPLNRMGKKCLPSKLKSQREYYSRNKLLIQKRRQDKVTADPSILVYEKQKRILRALRREKEAGYKKAA